MALKTSDKTKKRTEIELLKTKAAIFDDLIEFIEDKCLGHLMQITEKEKNIPLSKARKLFHA